MADNMIFNENAVYVLNKNEGVLAVFNLEDEDTLIDPKITEVQNSEAILTFQVAATNEKWKNTYNPENLYLVKGKMFSANFSDCIERERTEDDDDIITVKAYERQKLLEREYVKAYNSTTGFEEFDDEGKVIATYIDDFMVMVLSGGDKPLLNGDNIVTSNFPKGSSGYALDALLYGTGWITGTCDVEGTFDLETDQENIYDNILQVQDLWGGILVFDSLNKIVHHRDETKFLEYRGYEVKYQKNMRSTKYIGDNKIITKLCPLGEASLNIGSVNDGNIWLTNFSYTDAEYCSIENNDDIYEPEQLKKWGERKLQELCKPRKELTAELALLKQVEGYELEEVYLNDIVDVIDYEFTDDEIVQLRVIEFEYNIWDYSDAVVVLGDITLDSTDIFKKAVKATALINNGTLDTSKIVNYYQKQQSLKETLRQIDQTIIDTEAAIIEYENAINIRVTQTETNIDNLNNDIVSQNIRLSSLLVAVGQISSQVAAIIDLTSTLTSYLGHLVLNDAVEGDLISLSIHAYRNSFGATFVSDFTIIGDDLYVNDSKFEGNLTLYIYNKNICPTKTSFYENTNINSSGIKEPNNNYLSLIENIPVKSENNLYVSVENENYLIDTVYLYDETNTFLDKININDVGKLISIPNNCKFINYTLIKKSNQPIIIEEISLIKPQFEYSDRKSDFVEYNTQYINIPLDDELRYIEGENYAENIAFGYGSQYELGTFSNTDGTKLEASNRLRTTNKMGIQPNTEVLIEYKGIPENIMTLDESDESDTYYNLENIYFYDNYGRYISDYNTLNPDEPLKNGILIKIPENVCNINYVIARVDNQMISAEEIIEAGLRMLIKTTVYDEIFIDNNVATLIRRIGIDDSGKEYILTTPIYEDLGYIPIRLKDGDNIVETLNFPLIITGKYAIQNIYTDKFATKAYLNSTIEQTESKIRTEVSEKFVSDEKLNITLQNYSTIEQTATRIESIVSSRGLIGVTVKEESYNGSLIFRGIKESYPIYIKVYPILESIVKLYPSPTLYPGYDVYPQNSIIRITNTYLNKYIDYILPDELLFYNKDGVLAYDEFILDHEQNSCFIIKRCEYDENYQVKLKDEEIIINYDIEEELQKLSFENYEGFPEGSYQIQILGHSTGYIEMSLLNSSIFAARTEVKSRIKQESDSILLDVNDKYQRLNSKIELTAKSITLDITNGYKTAGINIKLINPDDGKVLADAKGTIDMNGIVTFNSLESPGTTVINGANIMTGSVTAEKVLWRKQTTYEEGGRVKYLQNEIAAGPIDWLSGNVPSPSRTAGALTDYSMQPIAYFGAYNLNDMGNPLNSVGMEIWNNGECFIRRLYCESGAGTGSYMAYVKATLATSDDSINYIVCDTGKIGVNTYHHGAFDIYAAVSDENLKDNIVDSKENFIDIINKIRLISFNWKESGEYQAAGFSAQQLQTISEDFVSSVKQPDDSELDEILQVRDFNILPYVVGAVQEEDNKVKKLENKVKELESTIEEMKILINKLLNKEE